MVLCGVADDGKAETRAADLLGVALVDAVEPLKDARLVRVRNADAGIGDCKNDVLAAFMDTERGAAVRDVIFDGVVEKIVDHLLEQLLHAQNFRVFAREMERDRLPGRDGLQPLDHSLLPNLENMDDAVRGMSYDPDNEWSVPYFWGSVGIVYNHENVDPSVVEEQGWEVLRNTDYAGHLYIYDSERDSFMMAFKALGYSMNTSDPDEINAAYEWLLQMNDTMSPVYVTDEVIDGMMNGYKDLAVVYSGDATVILDENEDMSFYMPEQGTNIWCDAMVIPANAENPLLAHEFINYMLTYEAAFDNTETVGYTSPNAEVFEEMTSSEDLYAENAAYLPRSGYEKDEMFHDNQTLMRELSKLWIKVKAAK